MIPFHIMIYLEKKQTIKPGIILFKNIFPKIVMYQRSAIISIHASAIKIETEAQRTYQQIMALLSWTRSLASLPNFTDQTLLEWSESVNLPSKSAKKGYSSFTEGYLLDVEGKFTYL